MNQRNTPPEEQVWWNGEYEPSPDEPVRNQVALYEATNGREGNLLEGRPVVILTTLGAQSHKIRKNPIMRIFEDGTYVAVASAAGAPRNPSWYNNLRAHPGVLLQDGSAVHVLGAIDGQSWRPRIRMSAAPAEQRCRILDGIPFTHCELTAHSRWFCGAQQYPTDCLVQHVAAHVCQCMSPGAPPLAYMKPLPMP